MDIFSKGKIRKDDQYLYMDRYREPLQIFKNICNKIVTLPTTKLLDIGAATGEFLYHLERNVSHDLNGLEFDSRLIDRAKKFVNSPIKHGDVLDGKAFSENEFGIVTLLNTHMIFDDLAPLFTNIEKWSDRKSVIYIFGAFNPDPADIWIRYKMSDDSDKRLQSGWNIPSIKSVSNLIEKVFNPASYSWEKFDIGLEIKKDPTDFLRQRTIKSESETLLINGLCQVVYPYIVEIKR
jgi:hypothetical protein